jgi:hypothetical protein
LTNSLTASIARGLRGRKPDQRALEQLKTEVEAAVQQAEKESLGSGDDFWAKTADPDARLVAYLLKFLAGGREISGDKIHNKIQEELLHKYLTAWKQFGSARELNSIIEHYAFLAAVLGTSKSNKKLGTVLEKIVGSLKSKYEEAGR